jgi:hypothetical protein
MALGNVAFSQNFLVRGEDIQSLREYRQAMRDYVDPETGEAIPKTTFLFRFAATDYFSGLLSIHRPTFGGAGYDQIWTQQAYMAQETCFFDFNIIQLGFSKDGVIYVIPVVSSPIDIVNGITPPWFVPDETPDWLKWLLMLLLLVVLIVLLAPVLPHIISFVVWLIKCVLNILLLPFKLVGKAVKAGKRKGGG